MSYYNNGGNYRNDNRGYRHDGGGGGGGYRNYNKINEEEVPESKHAIFVRGLPSHVSTDEVKEFFEKNVGSCSFDFTKVNQDRNLLFVAVRFETREAAKEAYTKYRQEDVLGYRCEVTWFRDIKRFISYQNANGTLDRYMHPRGRGGGGGRFSYNDRRQSDTYRRRDDRDRRSRSSRSADTDRSRSRSRHSSKSSRSGRSRSHSRRSRSPKSRTRSLSEGERKSSSEGERVRSESRGGEEKDRKKKKEKKQQKKSKKEKRRRSERTVSVSSRSEGERSSSDEEEKGDKEPAKKKAKNGPLGKPRPVDSPPASPSSPLISSSPIRSVSSIFSAAGPQLRAAGSSAAANGNGDDKAMIGPLRITIANTKPAVGVESTAFKMQLDNDEPPKRIIRPVRTPSPTAVVVSSTETVTVVSEEEKAKPAAPQPPLHATSKTRNEPESMHAESGGWRTVNVDGSFSSLLPTSTVHSGPPSDLLLPVVSSSSCTTVVQQQQSQPPAGSASADQLIKPGELLPRAVMGNVIPPPKRSSLPPTAAAVSMSAAAVRSAPTPPPPRTLSFGSKAGKYPEAAKLAEDIRFVQDRIMASVKAEASGSLRLSDLTATGLENDKIEERQKMLSALTELQKERFLLKRRQLENSYKNDCETYGIVTKALLQKDAALEGPLRLSLLGCLEDLEKSLLAKLDAQLEDLTGGPL